MLQNHHKNIVNICSIAQRSVKLLWMLIESLCICRLDVYNLKEDAAVFTGKRALISFLSWLDYCDQLIKEAQKVKTLLSKKQKMGYYWIMLKICQQMARTCINRHFCLNQMGSFINRGWMFTYWCVFCNIFVFCSLDSRCSSGPSRERAVLCYCNGASANANVSM